MSYPTILLKNQYGEQSNNYILGGSDQIDLNFIVDSTNGNGLGVRSVKGDSNAKVYMHTTSTPATGNPNPAVGYIYIQLSKPHPTYVGGYSGFASPVSGTPINVTSGLTQHNPYIITSVGTTTESQWQTLGLAPNVVPAVGAAFVAITSSAGSGTGVVESPAATGSGALLIDIIGDPNTTCNPTDGSGAWTLLRCLAPTSSSVTTLVATAPADGTVIGLRFVYTGTTKES
jgi:hypothetical protein